MSPILKLYAVVLIGIKAAMTLDTVEQMSIDANSRRRNADCLRIAGISPIIVNALQAFVRLRHPCQLIKYGMVMVKVAQKLLVKLLKSCWSGGGFRSSCCPQTITAIEPGTARIEPATMTAVFRLADLIHQFILTYRRNFSASRMPRMTPITKPMGASPKNAKPSPMSFPSDRAATEKNAAVMPTRAPRTAPMKL